MSSPIARSPFLSTKEIQDYARHTESQAWEELLAVPVEPPARRRIRKKASEIWVTTEQVAEHLGVSKATIERLKADAKAARIADVPWVDSGRVVRWKADEIDDFWKRSSTWRGSKSAVASIKSSGATLPEKSVHEPVRRSAQRATSSSTSKQPSHGAATGSLKLRAMNLISKR